MVSRSLLPLMAAGCLALGCTQPGTGEDATSLFYRKSPMRPITTISDGVKLEIVFVRQPLGDPAINEALRAEVDEQVLDAALRDQLAKNGFWAALAGDPMPATLESVLELNTEKHESGGANADPGPSTPGGTDREKSTPLQPRVAQRLLMLPLGDHTDILTRNESYADCFILLWQGAKLVGEQFEDAQCVFVVTPHLEDDGRVRLNFLPQLRYGTMRVEHEATLEGTWRFAQQRPRRSFNELAWDVSVSPREMVLVGCNPKPEGSLGYHFLTVHSGDSLEQNLIIVRLSDAPTRREQSLLAP